MVGAPDRPAFALVDHDGRPVSEMDFRGRYLLVYFGFTSCRIVCPRSLTKLSAALDALGPAADGITPIFITVDPDRDTPSTLRAYLANADRRFVGLTGSRSAIDGAKAAYRVFAERKENPADPSDYQIAHTAIVYLIGPDGSYLDHFGDATEAQIIVRRIAKHIPADWSPKSEGWA